MYVIGLVGPFGSGCSYVADKIVELRGYKKLSLSSELKNIYADRNSGKEPTREQLQEFGNCMREENGSDYLAKRVLTKIEADNSVPGYVIDSIRNPGEASFFRNNLPQFFLLGIFAEPDVRYNRVKNKYGDDRRAFNDDDTRDSGKGQDKNGQQVTATFRSADIIIHNNDVIRTGNQAESVFSAVLSENIAYIEKKRPFRPSAIEACMTMAYAASLRSSCLKRKVGAVIVDESGNVFSSGYNEVPCTQGSCLVDYGDCYRDHLKRQFKVNIEKEIADPEKSGAVYGLFKGSFKILDYCRALHAEENAILNVARIGASSALASSTLYTTTYPCNLCANKIAQVGIKRVVYFEPYPMEEAKKILTDQHVCLEAFQGVTFNGYFKLMEEIL